MAKRPFPAEGGRTERKTIVAYTNNTPMGRMIAGRMVGAYERVLIEDGVLTEELQYQAKHGLITLEWK